MKLINCGFIETIYTYTDPDSKFLIFDFFGVKMGLDLEHSYFIFSLSKKVNSDVKLLLLMTKRVSDDN